MAHQPTRPLRLASPLPVAPLPFLGISACATFHTHFTPRYFLQTSYLLVAAPFYFLAIHRRNTSTSRAFSPSRSRRRNLKSKAHSWCEEGGLMLKQETGGFAFSGKLNRRSCSSVVNSYYKEVNQGVLPKSFDFNAEERIYQWWETQGFFKPNMNKEEPFILSMPPPNVTGALHMGHAMFVTLEDVIVRHWRMRGRPTLWIPGTDHAGIATQLVVERMLASQGIQKNNLSREEFEAKVWEWKVMYGGTITSQLRRMGASCDWSRERFTLDKQLSRAVVEAFVKLHEKGLIYQGNYMVNWSPALQTAVSDLEVEYTEELGKLYYLKYPIAGSSEKEYLPIATTRPETLLGDTAIAVHPEDERYQNYVGRRAVVPLTGGREIPIIADKYVDREFGTGALKVTPGHDPNDYEIARRIGLPVVNIFNKDGTLNENAGAYSGLDRFDARVKLWSDLEEANLAIKMEPYTLRVPRSQRGGEIVEPLVSRQWFVSMEPLAKKALKVVDDGELEIIPDRFKKVYSFWLSNIKDWCISRQLWWGHRLPVWYIKNQGNNEKYIVARGVEEAYAKACSIYGADVELEQETDVLDTWFSSGLWPFSILGWPETSIEDFQRFYPTTILETGHDILFFWVARMVMLGIEFTGRVPFSTVYLHGLVRDSEGRKMSKTLGNVIDPIDIIKEYGTDALRFTLATGNSPGQDVNLSMERLNSNKAFTNKLWNAGKFILQNLPPSSDIASWRDFAFPKFDTQAAVDQLPLSERWVVTRLHSLIDTVTIRYENLQFGEVGRAAYEFFWSDFADWYIEASKTRLYNNKEMTSVKCAQDVLVYVFSTILKLLHPYMPFVTEELWQALPHEESALIIAQWPKCGLPRDLQSLHHFSDLQDLIRAIRNARAEYAVEPSRRISAFIAAAPEIADNILKEKAVLVALARLDPNSVQIDTSVTAEDAKGAIHCIVTEGLQVYLPLADVIDVNRQLERLSKQALKLQSEYEMSMRQLSSADFTARAPVSVVDTIRDKANEAQEKLKAVTKRVGLLEKLTAECSK